MNILTDAFEMFLDTLFGGGGPMNIASPPSEQKHVPDKRADAMAALDELTVNQAKFYDAVLATDNASGDMKDWAGEESNKLRVAALEDNMLKRTKEHFDPSPGTGSPTKYRWL